MDRASYDFVGNSLIIDKDKILKFDFNIVDVKKFKDRLLVRIDSPINSHYNENLFAISMDGIVLWQVQNEFSRDCYNPFTEFFVDDEIIRAYMYQGFLCTIDENSGKITHRDFVK